MASRMVHLVFPQNLVKQPVIFTVARECDVVPNIRRARVTADAGEVTLELTGEEDAVNAALDRFRREGVTVTPVEGDVVE